MKKNLFLILGFIIIVTISSCAGDSGTTVPVDGAATTDSDTTDQSDDTNPGEEIKFASPALEECVKNAMISEGIIETGGKITPENAKELKKLECYEKGAALTDISGIKYFTGIEDIFLSKNRIESISEISYLTNLKRVGVGGNPILDYSPLKNLPLLELIYIGGEENNIVEIDNFDFLCSISNLTDLSIGYVNGGKIDCIENNKKLSRLHIGNSNIDNFSSIGGLLNLKNLSLDSNEITDISFIKTLTNLTWFSAEKNQISDISFMSNLVNLENIYLSNNMIRDISALRNLNKLKRLEVQGNCIEDITSIEEWEKESPSIVMGYYDQMTEKCNQF